MRYRRLDLNLLIALDALLNERSVTRAAAKMNMTQPAMSGALARLRENFDDPLLVQVGRQLELTPRAQALIEPLHDIILRIDSALDVEPEFDPSKSDRRFVIVASDYVIRTFLLNVLAQIARIAPRMRFEFRNSSRNAALDLEAGEVDFLIGPAVDILSEHPHVELFEDRYCVIASAENSLIDEEVTFDDFMMLGHVGFQGADRGQPWADRWIRREYGEARRIDVAVHSFELMPYIVAETDLIAVLQRRLAAQFENVLPIKVHECPVPIPNLVEVLQWNRYRDEDPANQWFRELLLAEADNFPGSESTAAK